MTENQELTGVRETLEGLKRERGQIEGLKRALPNNDQHSSVKSALNSLKADFSRFESETDAQIDAVSSQHSEIQGRLSELGATIPQSCYLTLALTASTQSTLEFSIKSPAQITDLRLITAAPPNFYSVSKDNFAVNRGDNQVKIDRYSLSGVPSFCICKENKRISNIVTRLDSREDTILEGEAHRYD